MSHAIVVVSSLVCTICRLEVMQSHHTDGTITYHHVTGAYREQALADAVSALVALGYRPVDATRMARAADDGSGGAEEIIRSALRAASAR